MITLVIQATNHPPLRTVFLDRDGVLNRKAPEGAYVSRWDLFHPLPGFEHAVRLLNEAGLRTYVVTNQRGVALGLYSAVDVEQLHAQMHSHLQAHGAYVDAVFYCPHDKGVCACRKPSPGLFEQARALDPEIEWATSVMVGDSLSDMEAGARLGMRTIFIDGDPLTQKAGAAKARSLADATCPSLPAAVELLLSFR